MFGFVATSLLLGVAVFVEQAKSRSKRKWVSKKLVNFKRSTRLYFCSAQISESNVLVSDHKKLMENLMQYLKSIFRESFRYLNEKGVCKKKGYFVDYCNKCRCTDVGKPGYCSMKMCPEYSNSLNLPKELSRSKNDRSAVLKLPIQIFNFRRS